MNGRWVVVVVVTGGGEADGALDGQVTGHWRLPGHWAERRLWLNRQKWWDSGFCALTSYSRMDYLLKAHYLPTAGPFSQLLAAPGLPLPLPLSASPRFSGCSWAHLSASETDRISRASESEPRALAQWHTLPDRVTEVCTMLRWLSCYTRCRYGHRDIHRTRLYYCTEQATAGPGRDPSPPGQ